MSNSNTCVSIAERLQKALDLRGMKQSELSEKTGIGKSSISTYLTGAYEPKQRNIYKMAKVLNVNETWLMGFDVPMERQQSSTEPSNIRIVELDQNVVRIPVVGRIPAGMPLEAIEDILSYEEIPLDWTKGDSKYVGLVVQGDSMYPKYIEGDVVIIRLQPDCDSGQDCACYVNGYDATLKTVKKGDGKITLTPINTAYSPRTYTHPGEVTILGVVKELRRKF